MCNTVKAVKTAAKVATAAPGIATPNGLRLLAYHPNPFNPRTDLEFVMSAPGEVLLEIFDAGGRLRERLDLGHFAAGQHRCRWDARGMASGVYICRLRAGAAADTRKLTLLR